jgi:tRNA (guanine37-N1)-methyltransferase
MHIHILSIVPELLDSPLNHSIMKRAKEKGLLTVTVHHLRKWAVNEYGQVDDYQYGGGAGMVMMCEPLEKAILELQQEKKFDEIIYLTPDGVTLKQQTANRLSIGDYVLSGGELAAAVLVDAIGRIIPGVLNDETSALTDSFQDQLLAPPVYTRPADYNGWNIPDILLSGDLKKIEEWRHEQAVERTKERRPDLLDE